jgi:deoxyribonuclease-1
MSRVRESFHRLTTPAAPMSSQGLRLHVRRCPDIPRSLHTRALIGVRLLLTFACVLSFIAHAEPPSRPFASFDKAKRVARDAIYAGHHRDFYCGCEFKANKSALGGVIKADTCGYKPRKNKARGKTLEWEHVMPAYYFGHTRVCWAKGHKQCISSAGKAFKGRACCARVDKTFKRIEADLHNLVPAVGELNADRSNLPYGLVPGEPRAYGACNFEIGGQPRVTEPPDDVRGNAARIWFYMVETYAIKITSTQRKLFLEWAMGDPVDEWERLRDKRVAAAQGNTNPHVK